MSATLLVVGLACLLALAASPARADGLGQPVGMVPAQQWTISLSAEYLFEQELKDYDLHRRTTGNVSDTERKSAKFKEDQTYLATLTWGAADWLNLFVQAGWVRGGKWHDTDIATGDEWQAKLKDNFVYGAGVKVKAWEPRPGWQLLLSGRYLRYDDRKVEDWTNQSTGDSADTYWNTDDSLDYWQVDLDAVMVLGLGRLTPYVGAGWCYAEGKFSGRWTAPDDYVDYSSTNHFKDQLSALAGLAYAITPNWSVNLRGEFVARTAVGLGVSWTF